MMNLVKSSDYVREGRKRRWILLMYGGEGGCESMVVKVDVEVQEGDMKGKNGSV